MLKTLFISLLVLGITRFLSVNADTDEEFKKDFFDIYTHAAIEARNITTGNVTLDKITYYLFTRANRATYIKIDPNDPKELKDVPNNVTIVFIIHGWTENRTKKWYEDLKDAFLGRDEEYYVVQVDWSHPASFLYTVASYNTREVGHFIGEFLVYLHTNYSISLDNFLIVGHSLGGQVMGFAGKRLTQLTGKKLPRIIALDPAGPLFEDRPKEERLNENDAEIVEILHTDAGTFGYEYPCGTIDFYPNGGYLQPGCMQIDLVDLSSLTELIACDHHRSWEFYIEAISNPHAFIASKCESWAKFKDRMCKNNEHVALGDLTTKSHGVFYFDTNEEKPFSKII